MTFTGDFKKNDRVRLRLSFMSHWVGNVELVDDELDYPIRVVWEGDRNPRVGVYLTGELIKVTKS